LMLVAMLSSFIRVFLLHFNLTVFVKKKSFEINQGLLTKKSILLKKEKIQSITISTNPIKQLLRIYFVSFKQVVSGELNKKKNKTIKLVGCNSDHVNQIKNILFDYESVEASTKYNSNNYYILRMYFVSFFGLLVLNIIIFIFFEDLKWVFANLLFIPLIIILIRLKFKKTFYSFDEELLLVGRGKVETHVTYLPFFKVQNIKIKQTFFQKRKSIVDLILQTAAGEITIPCIEENRAITLYNYILYKVESNKESWM